MAAHNEYGVIQPLAEIAALAHASGAKLHSDAAQAAGKIPLDVKALDLDLLSLSSHKLYGPKGIGALYLRRRPRVRLQPLLDGGGQERGLRSGTLPTPLVVGFGEACRLARLELAEESRRLLRLRGLLLERLRRAWPSLAVNATLEARLPGNLNLRFPGIEALRLLGALPELALSTGSACHSAEVAPSPALLALGLSETQARESFRIGLGRFTSEAEVEFAAERILTALRTLAA